MQPGDVVAAELLARRCGLDYDHACEFVRDTPYSGRRGHPDHVNTLAVAVAQHWVDQRDATLEALEEGGPPPEWLVRAAARFQGGIRHYVRIARFNLAREQRRNRRKLRKVIRTVEMERRRATKAPPQPSIDLTCVRCRPRYGQLQLARPRSARATVCRSRPARRPAGTRAGPPGDDDGPPAPELGHRHERQAVVA